MKLYTEEQIKGMIEKSRIAGLTAEYLILSNQGIELPSDEEIEELSRNVIVYNDTKRGWFNEGAKWMKEQILNQNK